MPGYRWSRNGLSRTPEYNIWRAMHHRCYNPRNKSYVTYGARGIVVVERWHRFEHFLADMGLRPAANLTLERKNTDGPYSPENCVWETRKVQGRNQRRNRLITINGVTKCLAEWVELSGLPYHLVKRRINRDGWSPVKALLIPIDTTRRARNPGGHRRCD